MPKARQVDARMQYPGVIGPDLAAKWFTDRARELGVQFLEPEALQFYSINAQPRYPGAFGHAQPVTTGDAALLADWLAAFHQEAVPHYPAPARAELERAASEDRFLFWIDRGKPVSMAGIARRLKTSAAIRAVYTPPKLQGRGYAGQLPPRWLTGSMLGGAKSLASTRIREIRLQTGATRKSGSRRSVSRCTSVGSCTCLSTGCRHNPDDGDFGYRDGVEGFSLAGGTQSRALIAPFQKREGVSP